MPLASLTIHAEDRLLHLPLSSVMRSASVLLRVLGFSLLLVEGIQLTTRTALPVSAADAHTFLATPSNWPSIVASSRSVKSDTHPISMPMGVGDTIDEVFGLPPIIPLQVRWKCEVSDAANGELAFFSPEGLRNIAKDCRMIFLIKDRKGAENSCFVDFTMEYDPVSPIAFFATPVLELDNALAINVLLPKAIRSSIS